MPESSEPAAPETTARLYLAAFAGGDVERISALVSEDFVNEHTAALGSGCVGRAAYVTRLPAFLADMAGLRYDVEDIVADGSRVAAFYTMTARWKGTTEIVVRGVQRLVVENGLIVHRTDYWDSAVFLQQADPGARDALREFGIS
jgi:steroid delta-isomerase-like uncharacterized protein